MLSLRRAGSVVGCVLGFVALLAYGCSDETSSGTTTKGSSASTASGTPAGSGAASVGGGGAGTGGAGAMAAGGSPSGGTGPGGGCVPGTTQCTDCIDNDGDGWIDGWDIECIGPLDNDEGAFATGIPGDNIDPCKQDCFFDGNSGQGDDGCDWELACDPKNPGAPDCPYDPNKMNCPPPPSQQCIDACLGLTPNGCDCFGCCLVTLPDNTTKTVVLSLGCTQEKLDDPTVCPPCTQVEGCLNPCDPCEYCLGKTSLPPECGPDGGVGGGPTGTCPPDEQPCTPTIQCPPEYFCQTGCCVPQIPPS